MAPASSYLSLSRSWANLADGPAGLIGERLLASDVADYIRFRAVCGSWRLCSADPRAHGGLDRRFHPRRWILLRESLSDPSLRRFLNLSTGECIKIYLPELTDHHVLALTSEGLLILLHNDRTHLRLLNPLTRQLTQLPDVATLLPQEVQDHFLHTTAFNHYFPAWGSGVLNDDSTVALSFSRLHLIGIAKLGDASNWTLLKYTNPTRTTSLVFAGRFYCATASGVMVLEDQPLRLEMVAKLPTRVSDTDSLHLVDNDGELMLVHRWFSPLLQESYSMAKMTYDVYRVDVYTGTLCRVNSFGADGGRALFLGTRCSLSVSVQAFPSGSIKADTIYLSFDIEERCNTESYHLADRSITPAACNILDRHSLMQPHTLVDCLSFCGNRMALAPGQHLGEEHLLADISLPVLESPSMMESTIV